MYSHYTFLEGANFKARTMQGGPKTGTPYLYALTSYAVTSSNIDRFSNLFHCPDSDSEMFENRSIFDEVKAFKTVCQFFGPPIAGAVLISVDRIRIVSETIRTGADWAVWQPGTCQVGRLVRRTGGPPRQMLKDGVRRRTGLSGP